MSDTADRTAATGQLKELLKDINLVMLTTTTTSGTLRSRPMAVLKDNSEASLWFFTHSDSKKIGEINEHPEINLSFMSEGGDRYVSISGTAAVRDDRQKIKQLWNPMFKAIYPRGSDDPHIVLLQMEVHDVEYWDAPTSTMVRVAGFVKAIATGQRYEPAKNTRLEL